MLDRSQIFSCSFARIGPVVQWIVRKSPELDIPVRFWTGLLRFPCHPVPIIIGIDPGSNGVFRCRVKPGTTIYNDR
jgi:hypothetical protein